MSHNAMRGNHPTQEGLAIGFGNTMWDKDGSFEENEGEKPVDPPSSNKT